jgi:two-component sensor histidine kinase
MDVDRAIPIGLIVNELVTNAFKHAFNETKLPEIQVQLLQTNLTNMELHIADNGRGFSGVVEQTSFGMKLVQTLVEQLNGSITIENKNGMRYKINIQNIS